MSTAKWVLISHSRNCRLWPLYDGLVFLLKFDAMWFKKVGKATATEPNKENPQSYQTQTQQSITQNQRVTLKSTKYNVKLSREHVFMQWVSRWLLNNCEKVSNLRGKNCVMLTWVTFTVQMIQGKREPRSRLTLSVCRPLLSPFDVVGQKKKKTKRWCNTG